MLLLRRLWPDTALAMARLAALVLACASMVPSLPSEPTAVAGLRLAGTIGLVVLIGLYVTTFVRRRTLLLDPVIVGPLLVVIGSSRKDPDAIIGLCMGALTLLSMHSTFRQTIVRLVPVIAAMPISFALSPAAQAQGLAWNAQQNFALVPMLTVTALLNTAVNVLLQRQQRTALQEALLARTGLDLINVTDPDEVRRVAGDAVRALCAEWPDHPLLVVRRAAEEAVVEVAAGAPSELTGVTLPADVVAGLPTTMTPLDDDRRTTLNAVVGSDHQWHGLGFADERAGWVILVAGRRVPVALSDGLRAMATYWSLADTNCRVHAELGRRAESDQLTALYNRRGFLQRLDAARSATDGTSFDALLMIDLDDFKQVNDRYGHAAGDALLVEIAERITRSVGQAGWPARLGGDEFAVLLTGPPDPDTAERAAEQLREALLQPVHLAEATVSVGASIGIAIAAPHLTAGDLMRCADIAMYSAKAKGKNRVERFSPERHGDIEQVRRIEEHLAHAVDRGEVSVHYQPIVDIGTGRCLGMEALARWHDDVMGAVEPEVFVPLAVRTGQIKELGAYVLRVACEQLAVWRREPGLRDLTMSVNVAATQLYDPAVVSLVRQILHDTGVPADRLVLDLTGEPAIDADRAGGVLTALTDLGVRVALDDFGVGDVSITTLRTIPVHQIKIDESLTATRHPADDAMVQIIVAAGAALGIGTVAESVETEAQAAVMRQAGVTAAQGLLYGRPMAPHAATAWLVEQRTDPGAHTGAASDTERFPAT